MTFLWLIFIWAIGVIIRLAYVSYAQGQEGYDDPYVDFDEIMFALFWPITLVVFICWIIVKGFIEFFFYIGRNVR